MITPKQFLDAVADFEGLVADDWEREAAISEAASCNGIDPPVFRARLTRDMSIEERVEKIRRAVDHDRFVAIAKAEVAKCKKREGAYKCTGLLEVGAEELIVESVEAALERPQTEGEILIIEELWDPWIFELKRKMRFGIEPLHERTFGTDK